MLIELSPFYNKTYENFNTIKCFFNRFFNRVGKLLSNMKIKAQFGVGFFLIFFGALFYQGTSSATFFGEVKTGLQNISTDRYGYSLFVPPDYTLGRKWPLVVALHDEGELGEDYIKLWTATAKEHGVIVFCPTYGETHRPTAPVEQDSRILRLKHEIETQYEIDPTHVLVVGFGYGGHYAFYLGLRYPKEFTAIASVGNALKGDLKNLFSPSFAEAHRLPVLILIDHEKEISDSPETLKELKVFEDKGYPIELVEAEASSDPKNLSTNSYILEWFDQISAQREQDFGKSSASVIQQFFEWMDNLLQNR